MPGVGELKLAEPQTVRQSGGYGVKLRATAESIHMIRAGDRGEINPIVGSARAGGGADKIFAAKWTVRRETCGSRICSGARFTTS